MLLCVISLTVEKQNLLASNDINNGEIWIFNSKNLSKCVILDSRCSLYKMDSERTTSLTVYVSTF